MQPPHTGTVIGQSFTELQSVESTNNYALRLVHEGLAYHGDCFFAHEQSGGKGQRGKSWASERSANILLSIVLNPGVLTIHQQFWLNATMAVGVRDFLANYIGEECRIKWPNDLYWKNNKLGGILIENVIGRRAGLSSEEQDPAWKWAIAGIGININQVEFEGLPNAISVQRITGKRYEPILLAKELCMKIQEYFNRLSTEGFDQLYLRYNDLLYKKDELVKLKSGNKIFDATIKRVDPNGELVILHGIEQKFRFGEVEWMNELQADN